MPKEEHADIQEAIQRAIEERIPLGDGGSATIVEGWEPSAVEAGDLGGADSD